jgi:hypothetical protein
LNLVVRGDVGPLLAKLAISLSLQDEGVTSNGLLEPINAIS